MDITVPFDALQVGRVGDTPVSFVNYVADFSSATSLIFDFTLSNQLQTFGVPKTLFVDNGTNPSEVRVTVGYTNQIFTCPAFSQGFYTLNAQSGSQIKIETVGGSTRLNAIAIYNAIQPPVVWYDFGPFDSRVPMKVYGPNPDGTDEDTADYNDPVLIGGAETDGTLHRVLVDQDGRIIVSTISAILGAIYGAFTIGDAPVNPGVLAGVVDTNGDFQNLKLVNNEELPVYDADANSTLTDIETALNNLITQNTPPANSAITSVSAAVVSTQILAANANRRGAILTNDSTSVCNVALANVDAATVWSRQLQGGESLILGNGDYTGRINAAWASATGNMRVTEITV